MPLMEDKPTVEIETTTFKNEKFKSNPGPRKEQETDLLINFNENHPISVNKSVVVERVPFFASMCGKHGFRETNSEEIDITYDVDVTIFKALMDYIHTGEITLTTGNLEVIIRATIYFQLNDLLKFCCNVLELSTNLQTVNYVYNLAKQIALDETRKSALDFEVEHFESIAKSRIFLDWTAERMVELLSSDQILVSHEKKVLKFTFEWLKRDLLTRGESATDLFHKIRFSFLTKEKMDEVVEASSSETLCETLHQVASKFSNETTPPRIYHKGIYLLGLETESPNSYSFLRCRPDDGSMTGLKTMGMNIGQCLLCWSVLVVNNEDFYLVGVEEDLESDLSILKITSYDVMQDTWTSKTSHHINFIPLTSENIISFHQGNIFVFLIANASTDGNAIPMMVTFEYCVKTDTWKSGPFNGDTEHIFCSTISCGDSIYMTQCVSNDLLLQYTPSTRKCIEFPCQHNLTRHKAIVYKTEKILFFPGTFVNLGEPTMVVFNTNSKEFQYYSFVDLFRDNGIVRSPFGYCTIFDKSVYFFNLFPDNNNKVFKLDLSFMDEMKEPALIRLPDFSELKMKKIRNIVSIQ